MRELGGYHGEHRRHGRHAGDAVHGRDAAADAHAARAPEGHARNSPERAAQDALKLKMATDPEARKAAFFKNQRSVNAANAEYAARHARPQPGDHARTPDHLKPQEPGPEQASLETRDKPASRIAGRDLPALKEAQWKRKRERSWLPSNEASGVVVSVDALFTAINASYHVIPGKVDGIAAAALGVVVAGVAWANKHWKDKRHGDRPEG